MKKWGQQSLLRSGVLSLAYSLWCFGLSLVTVPILIHGLGFAGYGLYSLAFSIAGLGSYLDFGLGWTVSKFVAEADAQNNQKLLSVILRAATLYNVAIGLLFLAFIWPLSSWISHSVLHFSVTDSRLMSQVLRLAAASFLVSSIGGLLVGVLRGLRRFATATAIAAAGMTISLGGAAIAARLGHGVVVATMMQLAGGALGLGLAAWACRELLSASSTSVTVSQQLRAMVAFSTWNYMTRLLQMLTMQVDKILVGRFGGAEFMPFYTVPNNLSQKISFAAGPAVTAIYPVAAAGQFESASFLKQHFSGLRAVHMVTGAAAIATFIWADRFLAAWVGPEMARQGTFFVRIFALGFWLNAVGGFDAGCIEGWNRPNITFLVTAAAVILGAATALAFWAFVGPVKAIALGTAGSLGLTGLGSMIVWQRISRYPLRSFLQKIVLPIVEMTVMAVVLSTFLRSIISSRLSAMGALPLMALILMSWGGFRSFSSDERRMLLSRLSSLHKSAPTHKGVACPAGLQLSEPVHNNSPVVGVVRYDARSQSALKR